MKLWAICLVLGGCPQPAPDAELAQKGLALKAWRVANDALDRGDGAKAQQALAEAIHQQPNDPVLLAWMARAQAQSGDLKGAVSTLDKALSIAPDFSEAAYNRAAYLARAGDVGRAGPALKAALVGGARDPRDVLTDPDFMEHLGHPALDFLPKSPMVASLKGPSGAVFVGSDAVVQLRLTGLGLDRVRIDGPASTGPFQLSKVEERLETPSGADEVLSLTWTLRAMGPGQLQVGPLSVADGARAVQTDAVTLVAVTDLAGEVAPVVAVEWTRPSTWARSATVAPPAISAWKSAGKVWMRVPTGTQVQGPGGRAPELRATRVDGRQESWLLYAWPDLGTPVTVSATRGGKRVFEGVPSTP